MASNPVTRSVEQRCINKFLIKEEVKPAEILRRLSSQYGEEILSRASVCNWCSSFCEGREQVANRQHAQVQLIAVTDVNIRRVEVLILERRRIAVRDIASKVCASAGNVETMKHEHLLFKKVYARWVPNMLTFDQNAQHASVSAEYLNQFELEENAFLQRVVTCKVIWVLHFTPESKRSRMEWRHKGSPPPKKFQTQPSAGKIVASVFSGSEGDSCRFPTISCSN
jgi:hypothetical protein